MSFDIGQTIPCDHTDRYGNYYGTPTLLNRCPKCAGAEEYYDFVWSPANGNVVQVDDNKLLQELVVKAVLTGKGECIFHPNYGTSISASVGVASASVEAVARLVEREITKALGGIRIRQDQQLDLGQEMSDDELLHSFEGLDIRIVDERTLKIIISVMAESATTFTFTI